jgi:hypothetical protein
MRPRASRIQVAHEPRAFLIALIWSSSIDMERLGNANFKQEDIAVGLTEIFP